MAVAPAKTSMYALAGTGRGGGTEADDDGKAIDRSLAKAGVSRDATYPWCLQAGDAGTTTTKRRWQQHHAQSIAAGDLALIEHRCAENDAAGLPSENDRPMAMPTAAPIRILALGDRGKDHARLHGAAMGGGSGEIQPRRVALAGFKTGATTLPRFRRRRR